MEYTTKAAREASFVPPSKRSKSGWPHKTPTAADLSRAGFYFKPSPHSNDNTVCFMCDRNLDGWEKDDDPIQEHLKHAEDCGWAILMSIEAINEHDTSNMEDPTDQRIAAARKATFAIGWPHEEKRGWTCKTEKMVEAGWYFAPTSGSEDYVSCPYCKLSLDGWEPKDNPFEEHYSRSPSCPFFTFAGTTAPSKRSKAKKGRASRASRTSKISRLSTQSTVSVQSEAAGIPDLDLSIDASLVSVLSTTSTTTTKGKRKAGAGRAKTAKSKRAKTTKQKAAAEETEPEVGATDQVPLQDTLYPQLCNEDERTQQPAEVLAAEPQEKAMVEVVKRESTPQKVTGPPKSSTPTIPVSVESPIPLRSRDHQPKRRTSRTLKSNTQEKHVTPEPRLSPSQPSDVENAPPSARPESVRPPLPSPMTAPPTWSAVDADMVFECISDVDQVEHVIENDIAEAEKQMTVSQWIKCIAEKAENELRAEGERVVSVFEKEGQRALTVLEGIVCV